MVEQPGLYRTRSETPKTVFLMIRLIWFQNLTRGQAIFRIEFSYLAHKSFFQVQITYDVSNSKHHMKSIKKSFFIKPFFYIKVSDTYAIGSFTRNSDHLMEAGVFQNCPTRRLKLTRNIFKKKNKMED